MLSCQNKKALKTNKEFIIYKIKLATNRDDLKRIESELEKYT